MSNRKKRAKKIKSEQRRNQVKKELIRLKLDIRMLEKQIEVSKRKNLKEKCIRNLKVCGSVCNFMAPFVLVAGITTGAMKFFDYGYPFVKDDAYRYKTYSLDYQTDGIITSNQHYVDDTTVTVSSNILKIYSPWFLNEDGLYSREVRKYKVDKSDINLYTAILEENLDYIQENLDYDVEQEISNKVDYQYDNYIVEANLHLSDKSDLLLSQESDLENLITTIIDLFSTLLFGSYIAYKRNFKLKESINNINSNYRSNIYSIDVLQKQLELDKQLVLSLEKGGNNLDR